MLYEKKTSDVYQNSRSFICSICDLGSTDTEQNNDRTENVYEFMRAMNPRNISNAQLVLMLLNIQRSIYDHRREHP